MITPRSSRASTSSVLSGSVVILLALLLSGGTTSAAPQRSIGSSDAVHHSTIGKRVRAPRTITIAPGTLPRPLACVGYDVAVTASGGIAPYAFSVVGGALPPGLMLTAGGALRGLPEEPGVHTFTLRAVDAIGRVGVARYTLPVSVGHRAADDQVGLSIPPVGTGGSGIQGDDVAISSLTVAGIHSSVVVTSVSVFVSIEHARAGDLDLTLVGTDGTRFRLATQLGGSGASYLATEFSDEADDPICSGSAPFTGRFRPEHPIGRRQANGVWTLEIGDRASGNTGRLFDWSLEFHTVSQNGNVGNYAGLAFAFLPAVSATQGFSFEATRLYLSAGNDVRGLMRDFFLGPASWTRTFAGITPGAPRPCPRVVGADVVITCGSDGFVYALDAADGTTLWSRSTRRVTCSADSISAAPVIQLFEESNCAYQTAIPSDDLVIVGTDYACSTTTANKVIAIRASNGNVLWTYNNTGSQQVDRITGLTLDLVRNVVFAVTDNHGQPAQASLVMLNSLTGAKLSSASLGAIDVAPVLDGDVLYVLTRAGVVHRFDAETLASEWTFALPAGGAPYDRKVAYDPLRKTLFVIGSDSTIRAVQDDGAAASNPLNLVASGGFQVGAYRRVAVAPFLGRIYAATTSGRVYQLDETTGAVQSYATFWSNEDTLDIAIHGKLGGGREESQVVAIGEDSYAAYLIPWFGNSDHGGASGSEYPETPYCNLSLTGSTLPTSPGVGETITDSLTVTSLGNHAPRCAVVHAPLPAGLTFLGATVSQGSVELAGGEVVAHLGAALTGSMISIAVQYRVDAAGTIARTYTVSSPDYPDPYPVGDTLVLGN